MLDNKWVAHPPQGRSCMNHPALVKIIAFELPVALTVVGGAAGMDLLMTILNNKIWHPLNVGNGETAKAQPSYILDISL